MTARPRLIEIDWPTFSTVPQPPQLGVDVYRKRLQGVRQRMKTGGFSHLVVYADREHMGTMEWLTGFDPRFEEAIMIIAATGEPLIVTGNECMPFLPVSPLFQSGAMRAERWQSFSLLSQPRAQSRALRDILADEGIGANAVVGVSGWKYFSEHEMPDAHHAIDAPSFLVDTLRGLCGHDNVVNATGLFMSPADGVRTLAEPEEIAQFEWANHVVASAMRRMMFALHEGMIDFEAVMAARLNGLPLACHPTFCTGKTAPLGLSGPTGERLTRGNPLSMNICIKRANCCRAGWLAENADDLPDAARNHIDDFAGPYLVAMDRWFSLMQPGVRGGDVKAEMDRLLPFETFGVFLNPGHLIGADEWVSSPIYAGSDLPLRSGHVLQVDIIPSSPVHFSTRMEDTVVIADDALRAELKAACPDMMARIEARAAFMRDILGLSVPDSCLPLSDMAGIIAPFLLAPRKVLSLK